MVWPNRAREIMWEVINEKEKKNKYNAQKTEWFDSKKEKSRHDELVLLEKSWKIEDLKMQVPFLLQEEFELNWEKIRGIRYFADFVYTKDWKRIVEDSKWVRTDVFKIKKKMFLKKYWSEFLFIES